MTPPIEILNSKPLPVWLFNDDQDDARWYNLERLLLNDFAYKACDPSHLVGSRKLWLCSHNELCPFKTQTMIQWISWLWYSKGNRILWFEYDNFIIEMVKYCVVCQRVIRHWSTALKLLIFPKFQNAANFAARIRVRSGPLEWWYLRLKLFKWLALKKIEIAHSAIEDSSKWMIFN